MRGIEWGNIDNKPNGDRGWIIGEFKDRELPYPFANKFFSLKWSKLSKGDKKPSPVAEEKAKTLTLLVTGKHRVNFPDENESVLLQKEGDYVFFEPGIAHSWEAVEDNFTITLRFEDTGFNQPIG